MGVSPFWGVEGRQGVLPQQARKKSWRVKPPRIRIVSGKSFASCSWFLSSLPQPSAVSRGQIITQQAAVKYPVEDRRGAPGQKILVPIRPLFWYITFLSGVPPWSVCNATN